MLAWGRVSGSEPQCCAFGSLSGYPGVEQGGLSVQKQPKGMRDGKVQCCQIVLCALSRSLGFICCALPTIERV